MFYEFLISFSSKLGTANEHKHLYKCHRCILYKEKYSSFIFFFCVLFALFLTGCMKKTLCSLEPHFSMEKHLYRHKIQKKKWGAPRILINCYVFFTSLTRLRWWWWRSSISHQVIFCCCCVLYTTTWDEEWVAKRKKWLSRETFTCTFLTIRVTTIKLTVV